VSLVITDVSEELSASTIRVTRMGEVGTLAEFLRSVCGFLVTANVVPSPPILVTLIMEAVSSCETSVLKRATRSNIPEYGILLSSIHLTMCKSDTSIVRRYSPVKNGVFWVVTPCGVTRRHHSS
jgi:hypothetical protein